MSKESDQFNIMIGVALGKDPEAPKAPIRNIKIDIIQFEGMYGGDVGIVRCDGTKETHPTKNLYPTPAGAMEAAKKIKAKLLNK